MAGPPTSLMLLLLTGILAGAASPAPEVTLAELLAKPFAPTVAASDQCLRDSRTYFAELRRYNPWALQMYDASAKIPPGIITGNVQQLGNYDECLHIKTGKNFVAQACSASVQFEILKGSKTSLELDMKDLLLQIAKASNLNNIPNYSVNYEWMWCVPSTCNYSEISEALELALDPLKVKDRLDLAVIVNANSCHTLATSNSDFDIADWFYTGILATFLMITVASTAYDLHTKGRAEELKYKGSKYTILTSFSIYTNGKSLLKTERSKDTIACLDGLRFLSICWIIYGHTFYLEAVGVKMDRNSIMKLHEDWSSLLVLNGNIITDTFFLLSGILLSYTILIKCSKHANASLNFLSLYLNRYIRLTPTYAIVVGFYATLFDKLGYGPKWDIWVQSSKTDCRANWWTNLLYINNYVNVANICMSQSWYLSVDMQLLWISPIFLYPMIKYNRAIFFWIVTSIGLVVSILIPFCITYFLQLTGTMLYYKRIEDVTNVYLQIYTRVYARAGPYILGLGLGYILFKTKGYKVRLSSFLVICGWIIASTAGVSAILGPRGMYYNDHPYDKLEASFYAGLHRHAFSLAVAWIIFACVNGYAVLVNGFLGWRAWLPLARLTYSAYLSHYIILLYNTGTTRTSGTLSTYGSVHAFFGNLCLTMLVSVCLCCGFEIPFQRLSQLQACAARPEAAARLAANPSAELIFGSRLSKGGIGRSSEDLPDSKMSSLDSVYSLDCCVYTVEAEPVVTRKSLENGQRSVDTG